MGMTAHLHRIIMLFPVFVQSLDQADNLSLKQTFNLYSTGEVFGSSIGCFKRFTNQADQLLSMLLNNAPSLLESMNGNLGIQCISSEQIVVVSLVHSQ